jgi:hypothetical protein
LFDKSFATALRAYLAAHPKNRYLFQTRLAGPFTTRRVEQIVKRYALAARTEGKGLKAIAGLLEAAGIPCRGEHWHHTTVRSILRRAGQLAEAS